jgi:hypothetical protein
VIDGQYHVKLNGVLYRLAEGAEGQHYTRIAEPLRPPNSVVVQGEGRQDLFQVRPDVLLWSITDWSGGEGQIKFNPQSPSRHSLLHNVDPFSRPGQLLPGPHFEETLDNAGATWDDAKTRLLPVGRTGKLTAVVVDDTSEQQYEWNDATDRWSAAVTIPTVTDTPDWDGVDADDQNLYYFDSATGHTYRYNGSTSTRMNSSGSALNPRDYITIRELGNYVFLIRPYSYKVWELVKTASGSTAYSELEVGPEAHGNTDVLQAWQVAKGDNRLYVMLTGLDGFTRVHEIVPPTAGGSGYGREIARFAGFHGTSIWVHNGTIFVGGWVVGEQKNQRTILYYIPGGDYGTLGYVRDPLDEDIDGRIAGTDDGANLLTNSFVITDSTINPRVFHVDIKSGGFAQIGEIDSSGVAVQPPVTWKGEIFVSSIDGTTKRIWRGRRDRFTTLDSYTVSPWHDFGLVDEKILSSIRIALETLPADWSVRVSYALDGASAFTVAGTYSTSGGTGTRISVSNQSSTANFRSCRIKTEFIWTGAGVPTAAPILNSVEVRAQVSQPQPGWRLLLDLADDLAGAVGQEAGSKKIDNLVALGGSRSAFEFQDGYTHRDPDQYDEFDVVMDSYALVLGRPGEGFAEVVLREVS